VRKKARQKILEKLRNRYRLIIYNDTTFQSMWSMKLTRLKVFTVVSLLSALIVVLVTLLIATTPLREYIPGYPREEYRQMLIRNTLIVDSLENELRMRDLFFENIRAVMQGDLPRDLAQRTDSAVKVGQIDFKSYNHDSVFQEKILEERLSISAQNGRGQAGNLGNLHFFVPLKGIVTNKFNAKTDHFGVDLVSKPNTRIGAVLSGTVLFAGWTLETGYVIYIQHEGNLISGYKHNSELLKRAGDKVNAGEAVAIIGNSGQLTTGPHLHLELWYNGVPVDPEQYIDF